MKLGALHYISAVLTLHAKYIVYGALTKDVWEDKNTEFTSEIDALDQLKVPLEYGSKRLILMWVANGTEWVLDARR